MGWRDFEIEDHRLRLYVAALYYSTSTLYLYVGMTMLWSVQYNKSDLILALAILVNSVGYYFILSATATAYRVFRDDI